MENTLFNLLPQRPPLLLLDQVNNKTVEAFSAEVTITKESLLFNGESVPAWAGIEYMAQAVAAYHSSFIRESDNVEVGFIVGVRNYKSKVSDFLLGQKLFMKVEEVIIDNGIGSFNTSITINDEVVTETKMTTYIPTNDLLNKIKEDV